MKKTFNLIGKFFNITFALFSCVSLGMMALNRLVGIEEAPTWGGVMLLFLQILLFSALCALSSVITAIPKKLNSALAHIIRFVICYIAFYICFIAMVKDTSKLMNVVVLSTAFVIIYAVVTALCAFVNYLLSRGDGNTNEYTSVYDEVNGDGKE